MRILFLSQEHPHFGSSGGIGSYVVTMAHALVERGHEVHVLSCRGTSAEDIDDEGTHLHLRPSLPIWGLRHVSRLSLTYKRLAAARSVSRALSDLPRFDAIEAPEWMAESLFLSKEDRSRLVIQLHTSIGLIARFGDYLGRDARLADRLERSAIDRAAAISSPSKLLVREMEPLEADVRIIRLPVDIDLWESRTLHSEDRRRIVLFVGRLEKRKGIDLLIEALALLPERDNVRLVAIGASSGQSGGADYSDWVTKLASDRKVEFDHRPHCSQEELKRWYASARVLAVPSRFDSFSMVAAEGLAAGIAVVCTKTCGVAELIAGSEAGSVVEPGDPGAIRDALLPYLEDPAKASAAGKAGREIVKEQCSPKVIAAEKEELFAGVGRMS